MSYSIAAAQYADDVLSGEIVACEFVRLACQRFVDDLHRDDWEYYYDQEEADRWCRFLEKLPHVKGQWGARGDLLVLSNWQVFITANIFGWRHRDTGLRRFNQVYIEVPRKNGKSFWIAAIGVGMLTIDNEFGAEVYCGATSEKQAGEIFIPAKHIAQRLPDFRKRFGVTVNAKSIVVMDNGSKFQPIIGNPGDGASPSCAIADEFHEHQNSAQVDTMITGMGAREQPLMLQITTAGADMGGPCYEKRSDVISILKRTVVDERIFGIIYTLDEGDQWDTVEAQIKANPNYNVSVSASFLEGQLQQARRSPHLQAAYKTKHLNQWVGAKAAWMNMLAYQACRNSKLDIANFMGRECVIGIDLASKIDIASMAIVFPPGNHSSKYAVFFRHYLPEDVVNDNSRYKGFHAGGWLITTPGNVTDYGYIEDELRALKRSYQIREIPFDPFQATQFSTRMLSEGFPMVEVGATVKNFSEPMKKLEALIMDRQIEFDMDPVAMWAFGNVTARVDLKDNIFPNKEQAKNKIDPVVALIMAMNRTLDDTVRGTLDGFLSNPVAI